MMRNAKCKIDRVKDAVLLALCLLLMLNIILPTGNGLTAYAEVLDMEEPTQGEEEQEETVWHKTTLTEVDDSFAEDKWELILNQPSRFHRMTFTDSETGLYAHYNIFLPEKYDKTAAYPMVLFLPDSTASGTDPGRPLTQGIGGLVWTTEAWQKIFPAIVVVPLYREAILDHTYGYTTTGYVELTKNLVEHICETYAVDRSRIYGTGQGMGCEALMDIAAGDQSIFTACMFVSGQWNLNKLTALKDQKFVLFAAEDDTGVYRCAQRLMERFAADGVRYAYSTWNGDWTPYERTVSGIKLTVSDTGHYFVLWRSGTIVADQDDLKQAEGLTMSNPGVHVASFNAAYRCIALMEWMFRQSKPVEIIVE